MGILARVTRPIVLLAGAAGLLAGVQAGTAVGDGWPAPILPSSSGGVSNEPGLPDSHPEQLPDPNVMQIQFHRQDGSTRMVEVPLRRSVEFADNGSVNEHVVVETTEELIRAIEEEGALRERLQQPVAE